MLRTTISCALIVLAGSTSGHAANSKGALSPAEQTAAINAVHAYVLSYTKSLPAYTATLTVRHTTRPPNAPNDPSIQSSVAEEHLSFVDGKEAVDQQAGTLPHDFGNLTVIVFDQATGADLRWDRTAMLDHRKVDVLAFHVPASSGYFLTGSGGSVQAPFEGFVFADAQTHAVMRLQMKCTMIPDDSDIRALSVTLDYKAAQLAGREFVLPSHFLLQAVDSAQDRQIFDDGRYSAWSLVQPR
jgi:hypothetical protein